MMGSCQQWSSVSAGTADREVVPGEQSKRLGRAGRTLALTLGLALVPTMPAWAGDLGAGHDQVQFSVTAKVEARQDQMQITLRSLHEGADPVQIQAELKKSLDAALALARREAQPGEMDVRTGAFRIDPRMGNDGHVAGWQGIAEVLLSGRSMEKIASLAARLPDMVVVDVSFGLSAQESERAEALARSQAIARFRKQAAEIAQGFGYSGYTMKEVSVSDQLPMAMARPRVLMRASVGSGMAEAPIPVEAGRAEVAVTVGGTVQLTR